jgi:DNA-binding response OmpR family regulator
MTAPKTILVVEDDALLLDGMRTLFEKHGFNVETASDGATGYMKVLKLKPDLLLLDIMLPKLDGVEFLTQLKDDPWGKTASVIILTNLDSKAHLARVLELGDYDYLSKTDWSLDDLLKKVNQKLGLA